jgi:hypothetical protein
MRSETYEFPHQAFVLFLFLQAMDVLTTILGLRLGAGEGSTFIRRLLPFGPLTALLISKFFSVILISAAIAFGRERLLRWINRWYAVLVTWNLVMIYLQALLR